MLGAIAASGIVLAASTLTLGSFSAVSPATAASTISVDINIGTFYDRLEPYGNWVSYQDQYVFLPQYVDREWRPYTRGHWSYTRQYGWLWVSNERFGWATYHYGRWGYSRDIGWYWVPGRRWAPAWVAWSRGDTEVAWAPLPPRYHDDLEINITIGDVPDYYWQAVPVSAFLSINLADSVIRDRNQVRTIVQQRAPETVSIQNNIVINNVIPVNDIEKATNIKVKVLEEKPVNNPDAAGKTDANSVAIFNPIVADSTGARPKNPKKVDEIVIERKAKGIQPADVPSDQLAVPAPTLDTNGKPPAPATIAPPTSDTKAKTDLPAIKSDKGAVDTLKPVEPNSRKVDEKVKLDKVPQQTIAPPPPAAPVVVAPVAKPKTDGVVVTPPVITGNNPTPIHTPKKKKVVVKPVAPGVAVPPVEAQTPPADGQNKNVVSPADKPGKPTIPCDPKVETCPPVK